MAGPIRRVSASACVQHWREKSPNDDTCGSFSNFLQVSEPEFEEHLQTKVMLSVEMYGAFVNINL